MNLKNLSTLQIALGASVAVHAVLLTVRFVDPESFNRVFQDTPLEVILVNSRSGEAPSVAAAIAQANLQGGGDAERGRATSPLPPAATIEMGDSNEDARRQVEQLMETQQQLLAQMRRELALLPPLLRAAIIHPREPQEPEHAANRTWRLRRRACSAADGSFR